MIKIGESLEQQAFVEVGGELAFFQFKLPFVDGQVFPVIKQDNFSGGIIDVDYNSMDPGEIAINVRTVETIKWAYTAGSSANEIFVEADVNVSDFEQSSINFDGNPANQSADCSNPDVSSLYVPSVSMKSTGPQPTFSIFYDINSKPTVSTQCVEEGALRVSVLVPAAKITGFEDNYSNVIYEQIINYK